MIDHSYGIQEGWVVGVGQHHGQHHQKIPLNFLCQMWENGGGVGVVGGGHRFFLLPYFNFLYHI